MISTILRTSLCLRPVSALLISRRPPCSLAHYTGPWLPRPFSTAQHELEYLHRAELERVIYAAGCFWGVEYYFQHARGVVSTQAGYTGGSESDPTYRAVKAGATGHAFAVEVVFDPKDVNFEELTKFFFEIHDPSQENMQGADVGRQYRSAIFYTTHQQYIVAQKVIKELANKGTRVMTRVEPAGEFWTAEEMHQSFLEKRRQTPLCRSYVNRFGESERPVLLSI